MNQKHSHETMVEAIRLVEECGLSFFQVATKLGIKKGCIQNWVRKKRTTGTLPLLKSNGQGTWVQPMGYVPAVRAGMETYELLSPEVLAEFKRRQVLKLFKVIEGELGEIN